MGRGEVTANAGSSARRAERVSFYVAMGGPEMPDARAAVLLGVTARAVERYRSELRAAGVIGPRPPGPPAAEPCGTSAAVRRHYRRGERCEECRTAEARARAVTPGTLTPDDREKRNNMPDVPRYEWRARKYPWALRAIAAAQAVHGPPAATCACGGPLPEARSGNPRARCDACQPDETAARMVTA